MIIVVPSLGRAGTATSMKWLPEAGRAVVFAVHHDEHQQYRNAYPGVEILALSDSCRKHTGLVRREIMQTFREPFFFVDDDIRVSLKTLPTVREIFDVLENHMKSGVSMTGLAPQLFSTYANTELINKDPSAARNKFVATVYAINPVDFDDCPLEQLPVYEDAALVIHAIQHGGGTIVTYAATHTNVSPKGGGCNAWRNELITLQSLQKMVELYPDVCSIRETSNTTHSQHIGFGLRVAWSKIKKLS